MLNIFASIGIGVLGFIVSLLICAAIGREKITEIVDMGDSYAVSDVKRSTPLLMYLTAVPVTTIVFGIMLKTLTDFSTIKLIGLSALALLGFFLIPLFAGCVYHQYAKNSSDDVACKIGTLICCVATGAMLAIAIANMGLF